MKFLRLIGNVIWFITGGLAMFIAEIVACIVSVVTIIPLLFGVPKVHLTTAKFVVAPFGKKVVTHFGQAPIRNVVSLIFGGFLSAIMAFFIGIVFCITIIGIPVGKVMFGVARLSFAPFHAEIAKK